MLLKKNVSNPILEDLQHFLNLNKKYIINKVEVLNF